MGEKEEKNGTEECETRIGEERGEEDDERTNLTLFLTHFIVDEKVGVMAGCRVGGAPRATWSASSLRSRKREDPKRRKGARATMKSTTGASQ